MKSVRRRNTIERPSAPNVKDRLYSGIKFSAVKNWKPISDLSKARQAVIPIKRATTEEDKITYRIVTTFRAGITRVKIKVTAKRAAIADSGFCKKFII